MLLNEEDFWWVARLIDTVNRERERRRWMDVVLSLRGRGGLTVVAHYSRMNIDETLVCTVVS